MPDSTVTPWHTGLDPETLTHATGKGWNTLEPAAAATEAVKAHFAAQKLMGHPAEQLVVMPKDAADPNYQTAYDRIIGIGAPKTPDEYKFDGVKFKDGTDIGGKDADFVRSLASKYKLSVPQAREMASAFAAHSDAGSAEEATQTETTKGANNVTLRRHWNTDYDMKTFTASKAAEMAGLPVSLIAAISTLPEADHIKAMDALYSLGTQLNEAVLLRGGVAPRDPTAGMSQEQATQRMEALKNDRSWRTRYLASDAAAVEEFDKLTRIMVGAPARR